MSDDPATPPERPDSLTQRDLDMLLARGAMHFDGFVLEGKRLDHVDLGRGTYRGATFRACVLDDALGVRPVLTDLPDFDGTRLTDSTVARLRLEHWSMHHTVFWKVVLDEVDWTAVRVADTTSASLVHFQTVTVRKGVIRGGDHAGFHDIRFMDTTFDGTRFQGVDQTSTIHWGTTFRSCNLTGGTWSKVSFQPLPQPGAEDRPCTIVGGRMSELRATSGDWRGMVLEPLMGVDHTKVSGCRFENVFFEGARINAHLTEGCLFLGYGTRMRSMDFSGSQISETTFQGHSTAQRLSLQGCDFRNVSFGHGVVFDRCDLQGAHFPSGIDHVRFIDCSPARPTP